MRRSDGTSLAIGGILLGIGAVTLSLISPVAAGAIGGASVIAGLYVIVGGVYLGRPTPMTALERAFRPNLTLTQAFVCKLERDYLVIQVAVHNSGRDDVRDAIGNVIVPDSVEHVVRSDSEGKPFPGSERGRLWREDECFWNGPLPLYGRTVHKIFFRVEPPIPKAFRIRPKIYAPALDEPFEEWVDLPLPGARQQASLTESEQALDPSGRVP